MDIIEEKCMECNGSGLRQVFDAELNMWVYNGDSKICYDCGGYGFRKYFMAIGKVTDFFKKKVYLDYLDD